MEKQIDVVVVGAGPVGLLTAIELTLGGVRVLVLERLAAASMVMKAGGIGPLGIEALQRRGMAVAIAAAQERTVAAMKKPTEQKGPDSPGRGPKYSGHFAGLILIRPDVQKEPERRMRPVDQQAAEAMLADRASLLESKCAASVMSRASCSRKTALTWNGHLRQAEAASAVLTSLVATGGAAPSARWLALSSLARLQR